MSVRKEKSKTTRRKVEPLRIHPGFQKDLHQIADMLDAGESVDEHMRRFAAIILRKIADNEDPRLLFRVGHDRDDWEIDEHGRSRLRRGRKSDDDACDDEVCRVAAFLREKLADGLALKAAMGAAKEAGFTGRAIRRARERK